MDDPKTKSKYISKLLKPNSNLRQYDNEAYTRNPLLRYRLPLIKDRRHIERLKRVSIQVRIPL